MKRLLMFLAFLMGLTGGLAAQTAQTAQMTKAAASYMDTIYLTYILSAEDTVGQIADLTLANGSSIIYCDWGDGITESYTGYTYTWNDEMAFHNLKHSWKMKTRDVRVKKYGTNIKTRLLRLPVHRDAKLVKLDLNGCTALTNLDCSSNQLTSLDVSKNTSLKYLYYNDNKLIVIMDNEDEAFGLSKLPGFDVERATDWNGGTVSGNMLTFHNNDTVTYMYDTYYQGDGKNVERLQTFMVIRKFDGVASPVIIPNGGGYDGCSPVVVTINCETEGATIYFDWNRDIRGWREYTRPISFTNNSASNVTIKAKAVHGRYVSGSQEVEVEFMRSKMANPVVTPAGGAVEFGSTVTISYDTEGSEVYYTVDGSAPSPFWSAERYTEPIEINKAMTIKALTYHNCYNWSDVVEAVFTLKEVAKPVFAPNGGVVELGSTVAIHCDTPNATIHYTTNGSTPTEKSAVYTEPIAVNEAMTIRAMAVRENYVNSAVATATFRLKEVAKPVFTPTGGEVERGSTVAIHCDTPNATIHYTLDGSTPTEQSAIYTAPIVVNETMTIKALAVRENYVNSAVAEATFTVATVANEAGQTASRLVVYAQDRTICLSEAAGEVSVYTVDGRRVFCGKAVRIPVATGGLYIVHVAGKSYKLPVR